MSSIVTIESHEIVLVPRPHILYNIKVVIDDKEYTTQKRSSDFGVLHDIFKDPFALPPKRLLTTAFVPSAWSDDEIIAERKKGLADWLQNVLRSSSDDPTNDNKKILLDFLTSGLTENKEFPDINLEDALPSKMSRATAIKLVEGLEESTVAPASAPEFVTALAEPASAPAVTSGLIAGSYYTFWAAGRVPPEGLDYSRWDILWFAFVIPSSSNGISWPGGQGSQDILRRLVASAKKSGRGTKICLAIGGWGGCQYFSQACSTAANRTTFVNAIVGAVNTYKLDGIDLDWEYPNSAGAGQPYSPRDADNLLALLQLLRTSLGPSKIISAAVPHAPWLGADGRPLKDVSRWVAHMDYINIMNYDVWGSSPNPGPNAPQANLCGTSRQPNGSAQGAFDLWTAAKCPKEKLVLGCATYGYVSRSTKTVLTGSSIPSEGMVLIHKEGDGEDDTNVTEPAAFLNAAHANGVVPDSSEDATTTAAAGLEPSAAPTPPAVANLTGQWNQQIAFNQIVAAGALKKRADGNYGQAGGYIMAWDNCSNTPYLFNTAQQVVVSYDDTWSLADKGKFAREKGMAGCFTWSLDQDDGVTLQDAIRRGLRK